MSKDANTHHDQDRHPEKPHYQGVKEMPSSLPHQKVSPDGKKLPLSETEKKDHAARD